MPLLLYFSFPNGICIIFLSFSLLFSLSLCIHVHTFSLIVFWRNAGAFKQCLNDVTSYYFCNNSMQQVYQKYIVPYTVESEENIFLYLQDFTI